MRCAASLVLVAAAGCGAADPDGIADGVYRLPHRLREVSAVVAIDASTVACVQDEVGAVFVVDLHGRSEPRAEVFGPRGDYEGLALVGEHYWVLRSDGVVLRLDRRDGALSIGATLRLPADYAEWETLCWDRDRGLLLTMPKERPKDADSRFLRPVYAIDPRVERVMPDPVLVLDVRRLEADAAARGIALPTKTTGKGQQRVDVHLTCSELLALPGSGELLVLSSADHAIFRVDRDGRLLAFAPLDPEDLPQPEGLTLLPDGRLLVASEGPSHGILRIVPLP